MQWTDSLSVGVTEIDKQHMELINRINNFLEACRNRQGKEKLLETIVFVKNYTMEHFKDEETLMVKHNYPGYKAQKEQHDAFVKGVEILHERIRVDGATLPNILLANKTLVDLLSNHINKMDRALGQFLNTEK